ncbi:MAG: HYR domain-containing protein [Thaumarchaeota archaeon]|nr:HYR domain-containing protein [Nitrososphaerota archaeon]
MIISSASVTFAQAEIEPQSEPAPEPELPIISGTIDTGISEKLSLEGIGELFIDTDGKIHIGGKIINTDQVNSYENFIIWIGYFENREMINQPSSSEMITIEGPVLANSSLEWHHISDPLPNTLGVFVQTVGFMIVEESTEPESLVFVDEIVLNFGCINNVDASNAVNSNITISIDCVVSNGVSLPELDPEPEFFVFTDKSSYIAREFVQIFGFIKNVDELNPINVKVINPNEYPVLDTTVLPKSDGSFRTSLHTMFELAWYPDGEYQVIATSGFLETETSFSFRMNSQAIPAPIPLPTTDSIPPVLVIPTDIVVDATSPSGSVIGFTVFANDNIDGVVDVTCSSEPGTLFAIGTTTVICSALDNARNLATETFTITVENPQNTNLMSFNTPPITFASLSLDSTIGSENSSYIEADTELPSWIKQNAKWWSDGVVGDLPIANAIQFMMDNDIIPMPQNLDGDAPKTKIPDWLKNNAEWWADGAISQADFINCIDFLCGKGIIQV